jgi:hypothetical protein
MIHFFIFWNLSCCCYECKVPAGAALDIPASSPFCSARFSRRSSGYALYPSQKLKVSLLSS